MNTYILEELSFSIFRVLLCQEDGYNKFLRNAGTHPPINLHIVKFQANVIFMHTTVLSSNFKLQDYNLIHIALLALTQDPATLSN
jgi:hypothetical protein